MDGNQIEPGNVKPVEGVILEAKEREGLDNVTIAMFVIGGIAILGAVAAIILKQEPLTFLGTCITAVGSLAGGMGRIKNSK